MSTNSTGDNKRSDVQRFRATCPACGAELRDSSREFLEDSADQHEAWCDDLAPDQTVDVEEVQP